MKRNFTGMRTIVLVLALLTGIQQLRAQTITLFPKQVPNGISSGQGERFHQRFNILLTGAPTAQSRAFTITVPSELTPVSSSITATTDNASVVAFFAGTPTTQNLAFGLTGAALTGKTVTVEFDLTTPGSYTGADTVYTVDFAAGTSLTDKTVNVAKRNNKRIQTISFTAPDSLQGDTTTAGGRFYKLAFPSALPDPVHTGVSGLSGSAGFTDSGSDVHYSFYLSTDSTLVSLPLGTSALGFYSLMSDGAGGGPLLGTRQNPRLIPGTFIRENFSTTFSAAARDTVNGMISLAGTADSTVYYVYVLADPAETRTGYDPSGVGGMSGGVFLGRSGPLLVKHPPELVVTGWDYDDDGGDKYDNTGVIQVPSDIVGMEPVDANRKDNRNITLDSGSFFNKGDAFNSVNSGAPPDPVSSVNLLFLPQDSDNPSKFRMNIFLSTQSGLGAANLIGAGIDSLDGAIKVRGTDTLTINTRLFNLKTVVRDSATNLVTSYIPDNTYYVYFAASDLSYRNVTQVVNDPFIASPSGATLTVKHSPELTVDTFSLNDFDGSGDGDLDVITGIDLSQLTASVTGQFVNPVGPATRFVTVSWGGQGIDGDIDIDDNATIELYYSTRSDFNDSRGSVANTSGNSSGADLTAAIAQGNNDTHKIGEVKEDPDGQFDNQLTWDLWSYVSAQNTVPRTGVRYFVYALLKGGSTNRLVSLTRSGTLDATGTSMALNFKHPPYVRAIEPAQDINVTVDDPVLISWEAVDVDNQEAGGLSAVPAGTSGRNAPNGRTSSSNIRVLLTSADFGEVTTWGSLTRSTQTHRVWIGNSGDGSLDRELELNEGVDTSFVILGNRMRNNLFSNVGLGGSSGSLELQTNAAQYYVYVTVDDGRDGTVADAVTGGTAQRTNFGAYSPAVRAPGTITFSGTVPVSPPTGTRFIMPKEVKTSVYETLKFPIVPDVITAGTTVSSVSIFLSMDATKFEAVDQDPSSPGIQPFTLGDNAQILSANVTQGAYESGGQLLVEFNYTDLVGGLTFFDGLQALGIANLRAKPLPSGSTVVGTITMDNTSTRESKMRNVNMVKMGVSIPSPTNVEIRRRAQVTVDVPLEGRATTASDTLTFFLRKVGSYIPLSDSLFNTNDIDATKAGVQVNPSDFAADEYTLNNVPSGRWSLTASLRRHLTGQDTLVIKPGSDPGIAKPTRDGSGVQRSKLLAGDAAGYTDSTGASVPDNFIDSSDLNAMNDAFLAAPADSNYNTYADVNRDNIVNGTDLDFATSNQTSNTGASGKIRPVFPTFKTAIPEGSNEDAVVTLSGFPEGEVRPGESFDVTVKVSGARAVRTYEVHLVYDPSKLMVVEVVSLGDLLQYYFTHIGTRVLDGRLGVVNSILGQTPVGASGEGTLATVRFRAIGRATEAKLMLDEVMLIDIEHTVDTPELDGEGTIVMSNDPMVYHDTDGAEIKGLILATADAKVDFNDFLVLARAFGTDASSPNFDLRADLNADDQVSFADFVLFSKDFGKEAVDAPTSVRAYKPVTEGGVNSAATASLNLKGVARMGEPVTLTVDLSDTKVVQGWGLTVEYDADLFEFERAQVPEAGLLTAAGTDAPLFLVHQEKAGEVTLAHALNAGQAAAGEGSIAVLTFQPKGDFEDSRFEVFNGIVFDANDLPNQVFAGDALQVRMAPAQFALGQNYPNPFNPETTISYDLADASRVKLEIYNVMGQLVNTLVSEEQAAGRYRVVWNGSDAHQRQVASGVYFYRIQTEAFKAVRKLMLLK